MVRSVVTYRIANDQYVITVPKAVAGALDLRAGDRVMVEATTPTSITITKESDDKKSSD